MILAQAICWIIILFTSIYVGKTTIDFVDNIYYMERPWLALGVFIFMGMICIGLFYLKKTDKVVYYCGIDTAVLESQGIASITIMKRVGDHTEIVDQHTQTEGDTEKFNAKVQKMAKHYNIKSIHEESD